MSHKGSPVLQISPFTYTRGLLSFSVARDVSLRAGEVLCVSGSAHSRVSEFLHVLVGLDDVKRVTAPAGDKALVRTVLPSSYSDPNAVRIRGRPVREMAALERAQNIAFVFENPEFAVLGLTVAEEFRYTLAAIGVTPPQYPDHLVLAPYDLYEKLDRATKVLSGGELHRLAIACAMERKATVLVLDLTRSNLDREFESWVIKRLNGWMASQSQSAGAVVLLTGIDTRRVRDMSQRPVREAVLSDAGEFHIDRPLPKDDTSLPAVHPRSTGPRIVVRAEGLGRCGVTRRRQSFTIEEGQLCCFHGPNGCGKTSIARLVAGQESQFSFDGRCIVDDGVRPALAMQHCERSFLYTQVKTELPDSTLCALIGLTEQELGMHPRALPYQKQKLLSVAVAAWMGRGLAVLDEPSCGMDRSGKACLIALLNHFTRQSFLVFTHDPELQKHFGSTELGTASGGT